MYEAYSLPLKIQFSKELRFLHSLVGDNWTIEGDFDIIRFSHERSNRSEYTPLKANFNNFIATSSLIDLSPNNCAFTWSNF